MLIKFVTILGIIFLKHIKPASKKDYISYHRTQHTCFKPDIYVYMSLTLINALMFAHKIFWQILLVLLVFFQSKYEIWFTSLYTLTFRSSSVSVNFHCQRYLIHKPIWLHTLVSMMDGHSIYIRWHAASMQKLIQETHPSVEIWFLISPVCSRLFCKLDNTTLIEAM